MEYVRLANPTVPAGNQISNSSAKTAFADSYTVPKNVDNAFNNVRVFRYQVFGYISNKASTPGTLTLSFTLGSTTLLSTAAITLPTAVALSNSGFMLDAEITIATSGTSGKIDAQGMMLIDNAGSGITAAMVNTGLTTTGQITVNTQAGNALALNAQFSVADAGNVITATKILLTETP